MQTVSNLNSKILTLGIICSLFMIINPFCSEAQVLSGKITDEQDKPVPYATIFIKETKEGTTSNLNGDFHFNLTRGKYNLNIRSMGYHQVDEVVQINSDSIFLPVQLKIQEFQLKEVKVFPGKEDPAYFIMRKAIAKAPYYRKKIKHYSADLYIKSNFAFTNIPKLYQNKIELDDGKKLKDFFKENVTYVIESQNKITFDFPNSYKQDVISKKTSLIGFDEPPVMGLITTSIYKERPFQTISPLSSMALKHYDFRYEGYITVGDFDVFKIKVTPKRKSDELLDGYIYIVDKLWCVYNIDFKSTFEFFELHAKQQFQNVGNGNWLPVSYNIDGNIAMLGLRGTFYYGASVKYDSIVDNYQADIEKDLVAAPDAEKQKEVKPKSEKEIDLTNKVEQIRRKEELSNADVKKVARLNRKILKQQYQDSTIVQVRHDHYKIDEKNDSVIAEIQWDTVRAIPLTQAELQSYQIADSIIALETTDKDSLSADDQKAKRNSGLSKIAFGYYDLCKDSLVRLGYDGLISTENFDYNAVDGYKYRQQLRLRMNPDSGKYIYITPELGYAFNRKAVFGTLNGQFRNIIGDGNRFSFSLGKRSHDFKTDDIGISPALNAISTFFFAENYMKLYESKFIHFDISQSYKNGFSLATNFHYDHYYPLENSASYLLSEKKEFSPNIPKGFEYDNPALQEQKHFSYEAALRYGKRQRKPWLEDSPFLFMDDSYSFELSFKQGLPGVFNSISDFCQVDFNVHQQANISPTAAIDWHLNAGHFFYNNHMHFSQYKHFMTSEIPVVMKSFTNTFQLLNDYEFSTNKSYLTVGADFRTEYLLLRYFSFLNKQTWSESLHFNYLTTPDLNNYWEAGYSLNSLFFLGNIGVFAGFKGSDFESISVKISISVFD